MYSMKKSIHRWRYVWLIICLSVFQCKKTHLDVPFVPTPHKVVEEMLRMADVKKDDILYDLGCGDGRIVISAAQKIGTRGVGVDIDPERIRESRKNAEKARVKDLTQFIKQDLFQTDFSKATVVTMYLLPSVNLKLRPKLMNELKPGARVVSHNFGMSGWLSDKTEFVLSDYRLHTIHFWIVPANVTGVWKMLLPTDFEKNFYELDLDQIFQYIQGILSTRDSQMPLQDVVLTGERIQFSVERNGNKGIEAWLFEGRVSGNSMEGHFWVKSESNAARNIWKAERDPSTVESLDLFNGIKP